MHLPKRTLPFITLILAALLSASGVAAQDLPADVVVGLAWSPDETKIAAGSVAGQIHILNATTGQVIDTLSGHTDAVITLAWSPNGRQLASAGLDKTVRVWDANNGRLLHTLTGHQAPIAAIAWSRDSTKILSDDVGEPSKLRIWDAATGQMLQELEVGTNVEMVWKPDGSILAFANIGGGIALLDASTLQIIERLEPTRTRPGMDVYEVAWDPQPNSARIAAGSQNGMVQIWDTTTKKVLFTFQANESPVGYPDYLSQVRALAFNADGSQLFAFSGDGTLRVWNMLTGQVVSSTQLPTPVFAAAFSPDGTQLAYGGIDGTVHIVPAPPPAIPTLTPTP